MALDMSLFLLGLDVNAPPAGGGGSGPSWLPAGATDGVSFVDGQYYFNNTLGTDLTNILGASGPFDAPTDTSTYNFDPTAVTAAGMSVITGNTNRPAAIGPFLTKLKTIDWCVVWVWQQEEFAGFDSEGLDLFEAWSAAHYPDSHTYGIGCGNAGTLTFACDGAGDFADLGVVNIGALNRMCSSNNVDGCLGSFNGAVAGQDTFTVGGHAIHTDAFDYACKIGWHYDGSNVASDVLLKYVFFYPNGKTAAQVQALSTP